MVGWQALERCPICRSDLEPDVLGALERWLAPLREEQAARDADDRRRAVCPAQRSSV